jgi:hypothetical protein
MWLVGVAFRSSPYYNRSGIGQRRIIGQAPCRFAARYIAESVSAVDLLFASDRASMVVCGER